MDSDILKFEEKKHIFFYLSCFIIFFDKVTKKSFKSSSDFDGKIKYYQIKSDEPLTPDLPDTRVIYERPNPPARAATVLSNAPSTARPFQSTRNASRASGDYRGQLNSKQVRK